MESRPSVASGYTEKVRKKNLPSAKTGTISDCGHRKVVLRMRKIMSLHSFFFKIVFFTFYII